MGRRALFSHGEETIWAVSKLSIDIPLTDRGGRGWAKIVSAHAAHCDGIGLTFATRAIGHNGIPASLID